MVKRSTSSENVSVVESTDVSGGHNGSSTLDAIQMLLHDKRTKKQTDAESAVVTETPSAHEEEEKWKEESLVNQLKEQLDKIKKKISDLSDKIKNKQEECKAAATEREALWEMKNEEETKYVEKVAALEKVTGETLVSKDKKAIKDGLAPLARKWSPIDKQYKRIKISIQVAEKTLGKLDVDSNERQQEIKWREEGEKASTVKQLVTDIARSLQKEEELEQKMTVLRETKADLKNLEQNRAKFSTGAEYTRNEIIRLCDNKVQKNKKDIDNQKTVISRLEIKLQDAKNRFSNIQREIGKDRLREENLKRELDSNKRGERLLKQNTNGYPSSIEQRIKELKLNITMTKEDIEEMYSLIKKAKDHNITMTKEDMEKMNSLIEEMAKEHNIPASESADAHPDAMTTKDPSTIEPKEIMDEINRLELGRYSSQIKMREARQAMLKRIPVSHEMMHLTYLQNHLKDLKECFPFMLEQLDGEKALKEYSEQLIPSLLLYSSYMLHRDLRPIQEQRTQLHLELSTLQQKLQKKEAPVAAINREIVTLNSQLSRENDALETMETNQKDIQGRIDAIRSAIQEMERNTPTR